MTTFQQRLREEMVRRNYSPSTIRTYVHALRTCERAHHPRRLDRIGRDALRRYHASLFQEKQLAVGTVGLHRASPTHLQARAAVREWTSGCTRTARVPLARRACANQRAALHQTNQWQGLVGDAGHIDRWRTSSDREVVRRPDSHPGRQAWIR